MAIVWIAAQTANAADPPHVAVSYAESSRTWNPTEANPQPNRQVRPLFRFKRPSIERASTFAGDTALQTIAPFLSMPAPLASFAGQGYSTPSLVIDSAPPDTNGAAGPNHYVQTVNATYMIWDKSGHVVQGARPINSLFAGYSGTNAGNACSTSNDGDPIVLYDQLADRWVVTQFSLPNIGTTSPPSFECVAISKSGDPTGAYWLYDFKYPVVLDDYPKFGVWPDAYYAAYLDFDANFLYAGTTACAFDRSSMLTGAAATQVCFSQSSNSVAPYLPVGLEGRIPPPAGTPGFFLNQDTQSSLGLYRLHVDWVNPTNSTLSGPTVIPTASYLEPCGDTGGTCIPQPSPGNNLDSLGERLMFPATYRNFGTHESVIVNHGVQSPTSTTGIRWYEIQSPSATPVLFQQGTFAPGDTNHRFMGSIAQDQAQDFALGYSLSGPATKPSIAWTGRTAADPAGTMGQAETVIRAGNGVETGNDSNGQPVTRWGDYTRMSVDPSDDCTFWYTNQFYDTSGIYTWDTQIASVKFGGCGANNFSLTVGPATQAVAPGSLITFTISSAVTAGNAESLALNIQDLPAGLTAQFAPASINAGASSTLTLTASSGAPVSQNVRFTVIGKANSAVHAATGIVSVGTPAPTGLAATAQSTSEVDVSWNAVQGATYQLFRKQTGGDFALLAAPATNSYADTSVSAGSAYLYKVLAVLAGINSAYSNADLATTTLFTDDPLVANATVVRAVHLSEIRSAISAVATLAGTGPLTFTDSTLTNVAIKSVHMTELRSDLNTARAALGLSTLSFTNSVAAGTPVTATDFTELRNGVK